MKNCAIISIFMDNISADMLKYQKMVVNKMNPTGYRHYQVKTQVNHGLTMDLIMGACLTEKHPYKEALGNPDYILFLDTDCIPLNPDALTNLIEIRRPMLTGHIQRSNHIKNGKHTFVAPSCLLIPLDVFVQLGRPSANPTQRSDVGEEWTFIAEEKGIPTVKYLPIKYDAAPFRQAWETDTEPYWQLGDNQPNYGIGTEFESGFWHMFQSFYPGQVERFIKKCNTVMGNPEIIDTDEVKVTFKNG